ncbi:MAG: 4-hydroxythreonine-4-phosphate dehydrogenase PdxA [Rhizobiaceae bacterium]
MTKAPVAVTIGEPAGIGPDIVLQSISHAMLEASLPPFYLIGDPHLMERRAKRLGLPLRIAEHRHGVTPERGTGRLAVLSTGHAMEAEPGIASPHDAAGVIGAIDTGVAHVLEGHACALVTCPINKRALYAAGFSHPGHTEYLAELANRATGKQFRPVMMIAGPQLKTVPVTIHIPLRAVTESLTTHLIVETCRIVARDLKDRFSIADPRLAVCGLNPHAGEEGSIGSEDIDIIAPAVQQLVGEGIRAAGPLPADTLFHERARQAYDVAICMYHDQALIPAKTLAFDDGVNVTLGLPFIRTSPDHGTAYDIAGSGKANPASFIAALRLAHAMAVRAKA